MLSDIESKIPCLNPFAGGLSGNQRESLRRFEVERAVSGGFVVRALFLSATTTCAQISATLPFELQ